MGTAAPRTRKRATPPGPRSSKSPIAMAAPIYWETPPINKISSGEAGGGVLDIER